MTTKHVVCGRLGDVGEILYVGSEFDCEIFLSENDYATSGFDEIFFDTLDVLTSNTIPLH